MDFHSHEFSMKRERNFQHFFFGDFQRTRQTRFKIDTSLMNIVRARMKNLIFSIIIKRYGEERAGWGSVVSAEVSITRRAILLLHTCETLSLLLLWLVPLSRGKCLNYLKVKEFVS